MEENKTNETSVTVKKRKFNIIDLIFILILVAGIVFVGYKFLCNREEAASTETFIVTYYSEEVPDYVANNIGIDNNVYDNNDEIDFGTIIDVKLGDAIVYNANDAGQIVASSKEHYNSIMLSCEVEGTEFANGILVNSCKYSIGHTTVLRAGTSKLYVRLYNIEKKSDSIYSGQ